MPANKEKAMPDFGGILGSIVAFFQEIFGAILAPLLQLIGGFFPGA
jgi:hypothetical protein